MKGVKTMTIRKRTLPSGQVRWQYNYRDATGVRRARQFETLKAATDFETVTRSEIRSGVHVADSASITVEEAAKLWLQRDGKTVDLEASTMRSYREHVRLHIAPYLGKRKLCKLTRPDIEHFCDTLLETRTRAMVCKVLTSLKADHRRSAATRLDCPECG
jgi:hypothetical protein